MEIDDFEFVFESDKVLIAPSDELDDINNKVRRLTKLVNRNKMMTLKISSLTGHFRGLQ